MDPESFVEDGGGVLEILELLVRGGTVAADGDRLLAQLLVDLGPLRDLPEAPRKGLGGGVASGND